MVYVIVPVPPLAAELIVPLLFPLHKGSTNVALVKLIVAGWVTLTTVWLVQPFTSVPVIVYD